MTPQSFLRDVQSLPLTGLGEVADRFDAYILDLWGCIHDGEKPYPFALDTLARLQAAGKRVLVLSNAPRRAEVVSEGLARHFAILPQHYTAVLTSGEMTWQAIKRRDEPWHAQLGKRAMLIGPERDLGMVDGNGLQPVQSLAEAEFLLVTGPQSDDFNLDDQVPLLSEALALRLPMVCANPDLEVMRGATRLICAGLLAQWYEARGGEVRYHGKPYPSVYNEARALLGNPPASKVLAVGDGLRTDIAGAIAAGYSCAFIPGGIHGPELGAAMGDTVSPDAVAGLGARFGVLPTYVLPELRW
jgi:HAD superfamily hydrolase (TIGR01459 family)